VARSRQAADRLSTDLVTDDELRAGLRKALLELELEAPGPWIFDEPARKTPLSEIVKVAAEIGRMVVLAPAVAIVARRDLRKAGRR
jgi:hypothetical protein